MNIEEKVKGILFELSSEKEIKLEDDLQSKLALDSISMITLLIELEEKFQIELDESDMNPFDLNTVGDIVNLVTKYCGDYNE